MGREAGGEATCVFLGRHAFRRFLFNFSFYLQNRHMSYTSTSTLSSGTKPELVLDTIASLGFRRVNYGTAIPNLLASYLWFDESDYKSWTGIELDVYLNGKAISVATRTRASRSYWDLIHQNATLKKLRDLFGGHFETDAGRNRYLRPDGPPPSVISSGCFLARWRFQNAHGKAHVYLTSRKLDGPNVHPVSTGLDLLDEFNPRLLSNNFLLPYIIAIWEDYFRSTFAAVLKISTQRESVFRKARLSHRQLEEIAFGDGPPERAIADCFSFQRPSTIAENFRLLDSKLDLATALRKPFRRRKIPLFDSIENLVEDRNALVHTGQLRMTLFDTQLKSAMSDVVEAVNRAYVCVANHHKFVPIHDY